MNQAMSDTAKRRAMKIIKTLDPDLTHDDFQYELAAKYSYSDYFLLDINALYEVYRKEK